MKVIVVGTGRMGQLICARASQLGHEVLAAGDRLNPGEVPQAAGQADVIIDFSHPDNLEWILSLPSQAAIVEGTTGYSQEHLDRLHAAAGHRPVFFSANYSLGIVVLKKLAAQAAAMLEGFDIEIVETHHALKADAPSGTALALRDAVDPDRQFTTVCGRQGQTGARKKEIGIHALRGGTAAGDHDVLYLGPQETVKLSHHAESREIFVNGALKAAEFTAGQQPGLYTMEELLEEKNA